MEFCQISSFTLCTLKHDAGPQEWLKERSMANRKRAKDYLLSHQPHISSLPTWSHSSQPPWHVWVPLYKVETEAPKRLNTWSQFTKLELSPRLEPKTLSYNMLVPKDGKMVKKKKKNTARDFPGIQRLRLHPPTEAGAGSIPGQETKIPHATVQPEKEKRKRNHHGKSATCLSNSIWTSWWQWQQGSREASSLSLPLWGANYPFCLPLGGTALAFPGSWVWEACYYSSTLLHHHSAPASLAAPCSSTLCFSFSSPHLLTIFRVLTRGSKMIHLGNHLSIAWARKLLGPGPICVHPPLMHTMEKALALKPGGPGVPTRALSTLCQQQTSHALRVVAKHQCHTTRYMARHRAEPRDSASLLLHWLLNYFFTSKDNLSFSTRLLPGLQLFQRKCCFTGTLNFTFIQLNFSKDTDQNFPSNHTGVT